MTKVKECLVLKIQCLKNAVQTELLNYSGSDCLVWLNNCCSDLTCICKYMHETLIKDSQQSIKDEMDLIFLSLRQLIACVMNLERISMVEQKENIVLKICRQHFQERMIHCLTRIHTSMMKDARPDNGMSETNFVVYMDHVLQALSPLALNFAYDENQTTNTIDRITESEFLATSKKVREIIELLLGQVLAFTCVVSKNDKDALNTLCHRVMKLCIEFQEICLNDDTDNTGTKYTESDKRLKAQQLQNMLYSLDRLMNESFLRVFFTTFADFIENPLKSIEIPKNCDRRSRCDILDEITDQFDGLLDRFIQIGNFGIAYSSNAKAKSNLQSCLASFEAISISLIPSIISGAFERDSKYLEDIWNETIQDFRRSIQEIINTHALCTVLIDLIHHMMHELNETDQLCQFKSILNHCEILCEHIQLNAIELDMNHESQLKIRFEDFKMMMNECKACLRVFSNIDVKRVKKRFNILLASIKKVTKTINLPDEPRKNDTIDGEPFTFGHVTTPDDDIINKSHEEPIVSLSDSMNVIVDLNEFIEKNDAVRKELTYRSNIFYSKQTPRKLPKFSMAYTDLEPKSTLKRGISNAKRSSKRTSLRIAMFKRQKLLDTQKFIADSMSQSSQYPAADSLNLQITDILEQLSKYTTGRGEVFK